METDTGSTEREHSTNERRNKFRVMTHEKHVEEMSAWFCSRRCCSDRRDVGKNLAPQKRPRCAAAAARGR
eukprot:2503141-Pyramimonas_sp.AAC.1